MKREVEYLRVTGTVSVTLSTRPSRFTWSCKTVDGVCELTGRRMPWYRWWLTLLRWKLQRTKKITFR